MSSNAKAQEELRASFRALFTAQCAYVVQSLRRLGVPAADCPDVAHEVFMTVYRALPETDLERPVRPWLFAIAWRKASDYRQLARRKRELPIGEHDPADPAPSPDETLDVVERRALVAEGLNVLDADRRAVFVMHDIDGYDMPTIVRALSIPLNTGYSRLRLARAEFAAYVRRAKLREGGG